MWHIIIKIKTILKIYKQTCPKQLANCGQTECAYFVCLFSTCVNTGFCCRLLFNLCVTFYSLYSLTFRFSGGIKSLVTGPASKKNVCRISSLKISHRITQEP